MSKRPAMVRVVVGTWGAASASTPASRGADASVKAMAAVGGADAGDRAADAAAAATKAASGPGWIEPFATADDRSHASNAHPSRTTIATMPRPMTPRTPAIRGDFPSRPQPLLASEQLRMHDRAALEGHGRLRHQPAVDRGARLQGHHRLRQDGP